MYGTAKNIEGGILTLSNENEKEYVFVNVYSKIPAVTASIVNASGTINTNVFIKAITKQSVTIETSVNITGDVHVQVVEVP